MKIMNYRYRKRKKLNQWKVARRCVVFFVTVCVIPVILVFLIATDQYYKPVRPLGGVFIRSELDLTGKYDGINSLSNMTEIAERMLKRREYFKKMCKDLGLDVIGNDSLHRPNPWEYIVDRKHHLIWCNVFKAGSTSWMYNFNILAGYTPQFLKNTKMIPLYLARQRYPRVTLYQLQKALNDSISFIIVRHPLERLLSAYRDKIYFSLPNSLHRKLGKYIITKFRKQPQIGKYKKDVPTFLEFVLYILDTYKNNQNFDMHWKSITQFCTPCMFNFDVIAHMETLQEDQAFLIENANLKKFLKPQWRNQGKVDTTSLIKEHYSQLTRSLVFQLYHIYRYDFELFNYTLKGYLDVAKPDEDPSKLLEAITMDMYPKTKQKL